MDVNISVKDAAISFATLSGWGLAKAHFKEAEVNEECEPFMSSCAPAKRGHRLIGAIEATPVIGLIAAVAELAIRGVAALFSKISDAIFSHSVSNDGTASSGRSSPASPSFSYFVSNDGIASSGRNSPASTAKPQQDPVYGGW